MGRFPSVSANSIFFGFRSDLSIYGLLKNSKALTRLNKKTTENKSCRKSVRLFHENSKIKYPEKPGILMTAILIVHSTFILK